MFSLVFSIEQTEKILLWKSHALHLMWMACNKNHTHSAWKFFSQLLITFRYISNLLGHLNLKSSPLLGNFLLRYFSKPFFFFLWYSSKNGNTETHKLVFNNLPELTLFFHSCFHAALGISVLLIMVLFPSRIAHITLFLDYYEIIRPCALPKSFGIYILFSAPSSLPAFTSSFYDVTWHI